MFTFDKLLVRYYEEVKIEKYSQIYSEENVG